MEFTTQEIILRCLKPKENMTLHKIGTEEYYPEGLWLAKEETKETLIEEVPTPGYALAESGEPQ